jgi:uncharacterized protein YraI
MGRDITQCHPRLQTLASKLIAEGSKQGLAIKIGECFRTVAEQDALYAQGRTTSGSIVTNAKGSSYSSMHQWGIAFDVIRNDGKGAYNNSDGWFDNVGKIGKKLGLEWGGDWSSPIDKPHFQLADWGSTPTKLKKLYGTVDSFKKTWGNSTSTSTTTTTTSTVASVTDSFTATELRGTVVNATSVNLRAGAGTNYSVLCTVPLNASVAVQYIIWDNNSKGWYKVRYGVTEGYMSIDYVTLAKDVNNIKYAITKLVSYKIISSPDYWTAHYSDLQYLESLIVNMALAVTKTATSKTVGDVNTALSVLKDKKIVNTVEYWQSKYGKVKYLDNLIINVANAVK